MSNQVKRISLDLNLDSPNNPFLEYNNFLSHRYLSGIPLSPMKEPTEYKNKIEYLLLKKELIKHINNHNTKNVNHIPFRKLIDNVPFLFISNVHSYDSLPPFNHNNNSTKSKTKRFLNLLNSPKDNNSILSRVRSGDNNNHNTNIKLNRFNIITRLKSNDFYEGTQQTLLSTGMKSHNNSMKSTHQLFYSLKNRSESIPSTRWINEIQNKIKNYNIQKQFMLSPKNTKYCSLKKNLFHKSKSALQIFENKYIQEQVNLRKRKIISDDNDI